MEKHAVKLSERERRKLVAIVTKGRNKAAYIQRAHILLKSADGKSDAEISQWLYVSESTVRRTRRTRALDLRIVSKPTGEGWHCRGYFTRNSAFNPRKNISNPGSGSVSITLRRKVPGLTWLKLS